MARSFPMAGAPGSLYPGNPARVEWLYRNTARAVASTGFHERGRAGGCTGDCAAFGGWRGVRGNNAQMAEWARKLRKGIGTAHGRVICTHARVLLADRGSTHDRRIRPGERPPSAFPEKQPTPAKGASRFSKSLMLSAHRYCPATIHATLSATHPCAGRSTSADAPSTCHPIANPSSCLSPPRVHAHSRTSPASVPARR